MLTIIEARVVGCLLEKQRTVPDQYPLTLNALISACNQSSSRDPIMHLGDHEVETAIAALKANGLVRMVHPSHGRSVTRYRQVVDEQWDLATDAAALIAVLMLRGPQTVAELRTRTERQHVFASLDDVERTLHDLSERGLAERLERQPGQKEQRWRQLVAEEPERSEPVGRAMASTGARVDPTELGVLTERVTELEARVASLEAALADLL
jgi:uncharacterized protein